MLVEVTLVDADKKEIFYGHIEDWDTCDSVSDVYKSAQETYGRCVSKVYVDGDDREPIAVGWCFRKKVKYIDCDDKYLQEAWIVPIKKIVRTTSYHYAVTDYVRTIEM